MKIDESKNYHQISFMRFLQLCLGLESYSDLFRAFELVPDLAFKHGADILKIEKLILFSLNFKMFQVTPSDLVIEIFTVFKEASGISSQDLEGLLVESIFNTELLLLGK